MSEYFTPQYPWFIRGLNQAGKLTDGLRSDNWPSLDAEHIVQHAIKKTNLDDFCDSSGDGSFSKGVEVLLNAADKEAQLSTFGRLIIGQVAKNLLANRLQIVDYHKKNSAIGEQEIQRPLIVAGLPRTGTTILYGLLAQDPNHRTPMTWEVEKPYPPATVAGFDSDSRIKKCQSGIDFIHDMVPNFNAIHPQGALLPEECLLIIAHHFTSTSFQHFCDIPSYQRWLIEQDFVPSMQFHRMFLQFLQTHVRRPRWLLKSPSHLLYLPAIFEVYPDAAIIQTQREPASVIGSISSLTYTMRRIFSDKTQAETVGPDQLAFYGDIADINLVHRQQLEQKRKQVLDVQFKDVISDPMGVVENIYQQFDFELTDETRKRMLHFLDDNPQNKHGKHYYTLDQFGLSEEAINEKFTSYRQRFIS